MASVGPIGSDIGTAMSFPIACILSHALNGNLSPQQSIEAYIDSLWNQYHTLMTKAGKTAEQMATIHRVIIRWCGWFNYWTIYFCVRFPVYFPAEKEDQNTVKDVTGLLGLKMMRLSYDETVGDDELYDKFREMWSEEVQIAREEGVAKGR
jgi:hypothetical protein